MDIEKKLISAEGIKFFIKKDGIEIGRAYLYILKNDLHKEPFGFLEDVFVDEKMRGCGIGSKLIKQILKEARKNKCYKLVATSRQSRKKVHELYKNLGFEDYGIEFRIDLKRVK